jgi:peptide deformylase
LAVLPIRTLGDPVLRERAREVDVFDDALARLADDMFESMYDAPGVGLAAPQVGLSIRLFVYDDGERARGAIANPELTDLEGEVTIDEGCLSVPGIYQPSPRALSLTLRGHDLRGAPVSIHAEDLLARIFQHETDHLDGVLYLDRLPDEVRRQAMAEIRVHELGGPIQRLRRR